MDIGTECGNGDAMTLPINVPLVPGGPNGSVAVELLKGAYIQSITEETDGSYAIAAKNAANVVVNLIIPKITPTFILDSSRISYSAADNQITFTIDGLVGSPNPGSYFIAVFPADLPRKDADIRVKVNTQISRRLVDVDGNNVSTFDITPNRLYQIVLIHRGAALVFEFVELLGIRPQNYYIYGGIRVADDDFTAADFTVNTPEDSPQGTLPTTTVNAHLAFAVPNDTRDISGIQIGASDVSLAGFDKQSTLLTLDGKDYKWWLADHIWAFYLITNTPFAVHQG